jgi:hypothetical protein
MCEPVSLTMAGLAIAGAAGGVAIKNQQRKSNNKIKDEAADLQGRVFNNQAEGIAQGFANNRIAVSEEKQQIKINAMKARSLSQINAGDTTGLSVDAVLNDFTRQEGRSTSSVTRSLELAQDTTNTGLEGARLGNEGALFNLRKEAFNPAAAALEIGSAGVRGFADGGGFKSKKVKQGTNVKERGGKV